MENQKAKLQNWKEQEAKYMEKKERQKGGKLWKKGRVHLHFCCLFFAFILLFLAFCLEKSKKKASKKQTKSNNTQIEKAKKAKQMDDSIFFHFSPFCLSFFSLFFPFLLLFFGFCWFAFCFFLFFFVFFSRFFASFKKVRISYGLADIKLIVNGI